MLHHLLEEEGATIVKWGSLFDTRSCRSCRRQSAGRFDVLLLAAAGLHPPDWGSTSNEDARDPLRRSPLPIRLELLIIPARFIPSNPRSRASLCHHIASAEHLGQSLLTPESQIISRDTAISGD